MDDIYEEYNVILISCTGKWSTAISYEDNYEMRYKLQYNKTIIDLLKKGMDVSCLIDNNELSYTGKILLSDIKDYIDTPEMIDSMKGLSLAFYKKTEVFEIKVIKETYHLEKYNVNIDTYREELIRHKNIV